MDTNKICFIYCVNDTNAYDISARHLQQLAIPEGISMDIVKITDAKSLAEGYNRAMKSTDAKYKVYLHQDVFIIHKDFIRDVLALFTQHEKLGMLGVVGAATVPANGIWWESESKVGTVFESHTGEMGRLSFQSPEAAYEKVTALDGLMLITQYDITWREDLFDGWHFYDVSQCMEFIKAGYDVGVPRQESPWCIHDCGVNNVEHYSEYREIFVKEYKELLSAHDSEQKEPSHSNSSKNDYDDKPTQYYKGINNYLFNTVNPQATRVLDIGCGEGALGAAIKDKYNIEVYGFEYYPPAAEVAEQKLDHVLCGDIETYELPYDLESFDHIIFGDVLEHLRDPWHVLTKVKKYLKPTGSILTCIPNIGHVSIIIELLRQKWTYMEHGLMDKTHIRFFTQTEIRNMFAETGYKVDRMYSLIIADEHTNLFIQQLDQLRRLYNLGNDQFSDEARAYQYIVEASVL